MILPGQTIQILLGAATALVYGIAVMVIGGTSLALLARKYANIIVHEHQRLLAVLWLSFVIGQGVLGFLWLALSLLGVFYAAMVWLVVISGVLLVCIRLFASRKSDAWFAKRIWSDLSSFLSEPSWYFCVGMGLAGLGLLYGVMALSPPAIDDALKHYLVWAKMIAVTHTISMQPSLHPYYGLLPMQVEMHWAALFAISNETAVTVWDYLCALSFLAGIGLLAWNLTLSRRVALVAVLMMLSTPAFYVMIGGGKIDNASAQYGIAAALSLVLWPALGHRAALLAGLCAGWALASRYTNAILVPGLISFAAMIAFCSWKTSPLGKDVVTRSKRFWVAGTVIAAVAAAIAGAPMLLKNWLLVGCPLAPMIGCKGSFWSGMYQNHTYGFWNLSIVDLLFYPFVWTFADRESMLGNISPLFLGFFPFLLVYRRLPMLKPAWIAGLAGLVSIATWLLIEPRVLFSRFLLVPLALLAVPLSASLVAAEQDRPRSSTVRLLMRSAISLVFVFLLFESRGVIYAGRYLTSVNTRDDQYQSYGGYDVAAWLNGHVQPRERVALSNFRGHRYFLDPQVLLNSESVQEVQWLWDHGEWQYSGSASISPLSWSPNFWRFFVERGFTYVVVAKDHIDDALSTWPSNLQKARLRVAAVGRVNNVFKIEKQ